MRLLYLKADAEHDPRIIRQLARLATDRKITTVKSAAAAVNVLRKAPEDKRFHVVVTSPALPDAPLIQLVHDILRGGPLVTLVPVVNDGDQALRAFRAGADAVLTLNDGSLVDPIQTFRVLETRFPAPAARRDAVGRSEPTTPPSGSRVLVELSKVRQYFAPDAPKEPITVDVVRQLDDALVDAAARLVRKLSPSAHAPDAWELDRMLKDPGTIVIVAREGRAIVGLLTLHLFRAVTGVHAWIQDFVVDDAARGRGVSERLTREAVRLSEEKGACTAELTSRPSNVGTGRLYQRLGFERRETHLYRLRMSS